MNGFRTSHLRSRLAALVMVATTLALVAACGSAMDAIGSGSTGVGTGATTTTGRPSTSATAPPTVTQSAIPAGQRAVDALGLEILVPEDLLLDPPCDGRSVSRPTSGLTYAIGCVPLAPPVVWIETARDTIDGASPPRSLDHCLAGPVLDGERGCVLIETAPPGSDPWTTTVAIWPVHDVGLTIISTTADAALGRRVVGSARWVPIDRNGCAATRSPVVDPVTGSLADGAVLPSDVTSLSVCWYSEGRLVASSLVGSQPGSTALLHPSLGPAPGIGVAPPYHPNPRGPSCGEVDTTEGVLFLAHRSGAPDAVSTAQFADCTGGQWWSDGVVRQPVDEALASTLRSLTGFLLMFGYGAPGYDYPEVSTDDQPTGTPVPTTSVRPVPTAPSAPAATTTGG